MFLFFMCFSLVDGKKHLIKARKPLVEPSESEPSVEPHSLDFDHVADKNRGQVDPGLVPIEYFHDMIRAYMYIFISQQPGRILE